MSGWGIAYAMMVFFFIDRAYNTRLDLIEVKLGMMNIKDMDIP